MFLNTFRTFLFVSVNPTYLQWEGQLYISEYVGSKKHIIVPTYINGRRVMGFGPSCFSKCKAETIEFPGSIKNVNGSNCYGNNNIRSIIIGEGVETIGESFMSAADEITSVKISKSVKTLEYSYDIDIPFSRTPWFCKQDCVIFGETLVGANGDGEILYIPFGVKSVCSHMAINMPNLRKVIIPNTVVELSNYAFDSNTARKVNEFIIPTGLHSIGSKAFGRSVWIENQKAESVIINNVLYSCDTNKDILIIPEEIISIGGEVFSGNRNIKSIVFPKSLKSIGKQAFAECQKLTAIDLPEGVERLERACFYSCKKLSKVKLPDSLVEIGRSAFNSCPSLTEISLGKSVEIIGEKAFLECSMLMNIEMNSKVQKIGTEAFSKCSVLSHIVLPDTLTEIGSGVFNGCVSLEDIAIPSGVTKIESSMFSGCKSLKTVSIPDGLLEIDNSAFSGCVLLESLVLPAKVGQQAFSGCTGLKKITFDHATTVFEKNTFFGCVGLQEIIIPDSVTKICEGAFSGCTGVEKVTLPKSLEVIEKSAFSGCMNLTCIEIPAKVSSIGDNAFMDCTKLSEVYMPDTIENFGLDVFTNSPYIKKEFGDFVVIDGILSKYLGTEKDVVIPESVSYIGENAFAEAYHVESIVIPDSVKTIAHKLMGNVYTRQYNRIPQLKKLVIGNGVASIGDEAFSNCKALTEVTFGHALSSIGQNAFADCKNLKEIDLSETSLAEIKQKAFSGCYGVNKLKLPEKIEIIGRSAFSSISLGIIRLPKTMKRVEYSAFDGASELIVYDSIEPDAVEANEWKFDKVNGSVNSPLACALLGIPQNYVECHGNTKWRKYHITVLSTETEKIRYRIFCDDEEKNYNYRAMMFSAWGKHASFIFELYDEYFMKTRSILGRTEMAFCRIQYPEGLSAMHRANYEAFLERCIYIERSAKRTAELIANDDAVERLEILTRYRAIDTHNLEWIKEQMQKKNAMKCLAYLNTNFSMKEGIMNA